MKIFLNKLSIAWKLPLMIVGAGSLVGVCIGFAAYWNAASTLGSEARVRLSAVLESRKASLGDYLGSIEEDLQFVASNPTTRLAIFKFKSGWKRLEGNKGEKLRDLYIDENPHPLGSKENLDAASDGSLYSDVHGTYHPWFRDFLRARGYYDIFLFDLEGNLIYSVFKEADYATNLESGKYRDTDLGKAFRAARENPSRDFEAFFDFRSYAPSHGAPASFISAPVLDKKGRVMGVLAFQMPIDRLNAVVQQTAGLGVTGESFLVGDDHLMRTDSRFSQESTILTRKIESEAVDKALEGEHGAIGLIDMNGEEAIAAYTFVDFNGTRWAMLAEMARHEIMAPAATMAARLLAITFGALLGLAAIGWYLARDVVNPLVQMATAVDLMAQGETTEVPGTRRYDEIGSVSRSLETISQKGLEAARLRSALDGCSTMVMVSNKRGDIIYVNPALLQMLQKFGAEIRKDLPAIDVNNLIGVNIDAIDQSLSHDHVIAGSFTAGRELDIDAGSRRFRLTASPIQNASGTHLGIVLEWLDRTVELSMQSEIDRVINAARQGDFSQAIDLDGVDGTYRGLADGMNELTRVVSHATEELATMLAAMAEGDLDRRIEADFQGQLGDLKNHANNTASQLATIVGDVKTAAGEIASAASEINSGTEDLSHRTEQAASSLEETAAATDQMSSTVKQNAENAKEADQLAEAANRTASKGGKVVEQAVCAMTGIEDSAQKITDIIGVIDEIAFQTNLLALNASVEAARAGEAGKGFAVVAQEVRQLAQRSAQAASDIKTLIQDSNNQVKDGVQLVNQAGEALGEIVGSIGKVTEIVQKISSASQEQSSGVQEINSSISNMDQMTQQNAALVEESTAGARALSDEAGKLSELMAFFKLNGASAPVRRASNASQRPSLSNPAQPVTKPQPAVAVADAEGWSEF